MILAEPLTVELDENSTLQNAKNIKARNLLIPGDTGCNHLCKLVGKVKTKNATQNFGIHTSSKN